MWKCTHGQACIFRQHACCAGRTCPWDSSNIDGYASACMVALKPWQMWLHSATHAIVSHPPCIGGIRESWQSGPSIIVEQSTCCMPYASVNRGCAYSMFWLHYIRSYDMDMAKKAGRMLVNVILTIIITIGVGVMVILLPFLIAILLESK